MANKNIIPDGQKEPTMSKASILNGITVIDLTQALSGPFCTLILAELGADVIKVENPNGGDMARNNTPYLGRNGLTLTRQNEDDLSLAALNRLRGKRSITLDLKHPDASKVFSDLVCNADVVVENFSAGTADRLNIGYSMAQKVNSKIIYCSISGYGSEAESGARAMDIIVQALSGVMLTSGGIADPPIRLGVPVADMIVPLWASIGIISALYHRERTGLGQYVDSSMLGALTSLVATEDWDALEELGQPLRSGPTLPRLAPWGLFRCADGWVSIVAPRDKFVFLLFEAMGRSELCTDPRFATRDSRVENEPLLTQEIESWTSALPVCTVVEMLANAGVPTAPVRDPKTAMRDPRVVARSETVPVIHPVLGTFEQYRTSGIPVQFSGAIVGNSMPAAPRLGEHTDEILSSIAGYSPNQIEALHQAGTI